MANKVTDSGTSKAATADIRVFPTITDIGVPTEGLVANPNDPNGPTRMRQNTYPAAATTASKGVGVPYSPIHGTTVK